MCCAGPAQDRLLGGLLARELCRSAREAFAAHAAAVMPLAFVAQQDADAQTKVRRRALSLPGRLDPLCAAGLLCSAGRGCADRGLPLWAAGVWTCALVWPQLALLHAWPSCCQPHARSRTQSPDTCALSGRAWPQREQNWKLNLDTCLLPKAIGQPVHCAAQTGCWSRGGGSQRAARPDPFVGPPFRWRAVGTWRAVACAASRPA